MAQVAWHQLVCRGSGCGAMFYICGSCYRGQAYCGDGCRKKAQVQQRRKANQKHQDSPEGRLDHRDRQRTYREKCRLSVTDAPSPGRTRSGNIKKPSMEMGISTSFGEGFQGRPRFGRPRTAIRRFGKRTFSALDLVEQKALPENVKEAAEQMLMTRRNILVSGGTGSGKTTLLNALIELLPDDERIVAIEDTLELRIDHSNCVRFEARGLQEGAVTIRDLVRHALRHRPDHIVVGEVRGGEAADLLQALNTGHGGSLTTVHANNAESALSRIASCAMQGGGELPWEVTCRGVVDGIAMVIHMTRREGRRFVEEAAFVKGYEAKENRWDIERLERVSLTS